MNLHQTQLANECEDIPSVSIDQIESAPEVFQSELGDYFPFIIETSDETESELHNSEPAVLDHRRNGDQLNELHEKVRLASADQKEAAVAALLEDVRNYAVRVVTKEAAKNNWKAAFALTEDIVQQAVLKVWTNLTNFNGESKFSSWVYKVVKNTALDVVGSAAHRNECEYFEWKDYEADPSCRRGECSGASPDSGVSISSDAPISSSDKYGDDTDANSGCPRGPIQSKKHREAAETGLDADIDLASAFQKLNKQDREIAEAILHGLKPEELATEFRNRKQLYNRYTKLRNLLRHEMGVNDTVLHTCQHAADSVHRLEVGRAYTSEGTFYRLLPSQCHCRKLLTRLEAEALMERGGASAVYIVYDQKLHRHRFGKDLKDGSIVVDSSQVWASKSVRIPRVGLNSKGNVKRALGNDVQAVSDIEWSHRLSQESLQSLIVAFRTDPCEGIARFTTYTDQRSRNCRAPHRGAPTVKPSPPETSAAPLEGEYSCPACQRNRLEVG